MRRNRVVDSLSYAVVRAERPAMRIPAFKPQAENPVDQFEQRPMVGGVIQQAQRKRVDLRVALVILADPLGQRV